MTPAQRDAIGELAEQYDAVAVTREQDRIDRLLVACFAGEIELDRFRITGNGLTLGILPDDPALTAPLPHPFV